MTVEELARHIAWGLDGGYDDGLEAYVGARAYGASIVVKVVPDNGPARHYRAVLVEVVEVAP